MEVEMQSGDAAETLREIDRLRRETRRRRRAGPEQLWLPLLLFGSLVLVTPAVDAAWGGRAVGIYWAIAGPLGAILCGWYYRRRERQVGLEVPALPYLLVSVGIVLGSLVLGWIGGVTDSQLEWAGPLLVVCAGYAIFAWLDRSVGLAVLAAAMAAVVLGVYASPIEDQTANVLATLSFGGMFVVTGLFLLWRRARKA